MKFFKRKPATVNVEKSSQTERIGLFDLVVVGVLAGAALVFSQLWQYPGLSPSLWGDAAVASGVRPASAVLPGYWRALATLVYHGGGISVAEIALKFLGHLSLAALAVGFYAVSREVLAFVMRARPQFSRRRTMVMRLASAVGAVTFVGSEPVWTAGQCFCETTILLLLAVGAVETYFLFMRKGTLKYAYLCALLLGVLSAESMIGVFLLFAFVALYAFVLKVMPAMESPFFRPAVIAVGKWHMTFIFLFALLCGIALNCATYISHSGLDAVGASFGDLPFAYLKLYWSRMYNATNRMGWILTGGIMLMPFVIAVVKFPGAADEERFLQYSTGIVFLVLGVLAVSQSCAIPALWYWNYCRIDSPVVLTIGAFLLGLTLACSVTILGVDALCRNHRRLARQFYGSADSDWANDEEDLKAKSRLARLVRWFGIVLVPAVIVFAVLPGRKKTEACEMVAIVDEAVAAMVTEAGDSEYIFTNGNLDPAIEMESARRGGSLKCVSLLGKGGAMDVYLRTRGLGGDPEDLMAFRHDGGMGLRTWMRDKPEKLAKSAVQIGFDLWKRDGRAIPEIGGYLSRPGVKVDPAVRKAAIDHSRELARRILAVHARGGMRKCTDKSLVDAVHAVQWRIARMCTYRAEVYDLDGKAAEAIAEVSLAKELNDNNDVYLGLLRTSERANEQLLTRLTPREGLQLALVRADFTMAKYYSEMILVTQPENADANFAMGMYYLKQRQLTRAEEYLKRCLLTNPKEPAVYNNLAMIQMELGRNDAALANVEKALAIIPDSSAVRDTKKQILDAMAKRSGGAGAANGGAKPGTPR